MGKKLIASPPISGRPPLPVFSSFMAGLTSCLTKLSVINKEKDDAMRMLRRYLKQTGASRLLSTAAIRYAERTMDESHLRTRSTDVKALKALPLHLKMDLRMEELCSLMVEHPLLNVMLNREAV